MGIFDRIKFIARAYVGSLKRKIGETKKRIRESDILQDGEDSESPADIEEEQRRVDEEWERLKNGIKSKIRPMDPKLAKYYYILGLKFGADLEAVTNKKKELLRANHPDRFPDPKQKALAEEKTKKINQAYEEIAAFFGK